MFSQESDILRKLRLIENLKAEIIMHAGQLYQAMARNSQQAIGESLAGVIITCFVLARRVGFDFNTLEQAIVERLDKEIGREPEAEQWHGDYSEYRRYLRQKR